MSSANRGLYFIIYVYVLAYFYYYYYVMLLHLILRIKSIQITLEISDLKCSTRKRNVLLKWLVEYRGTLKTISLSFSKYILGRRYVRI